MSEASRRSGWGVLASCAVHGAVALAIRGVGRASQPAALKPIWMELRVEPREPPVAPVAPITQPLEPPARERARSARVVSRAVAREVVAPQPSVAADETAASVLPTHVQPAPALDLSPLAAARTLGDSPYFPQHDAGVAARDDVPASPRAQADALAEQVPGLHASKGPSRSAEKVVVDAVEDTLYNVMRPWKLLQRQAMRRSQYRYRGAGFDAAILADGRVRFRDKDGLTVTLSASQTREFGPGSAVGPTPTIGFSLVDPRALWYRLRGKDPFAAERRTFLERTRALREYLAGRAATRGASSEDEPDAEAEPQLEPAAP